MKQISIAVALILGVVMLIPIALTIGNSFKGQVESKYAPLRIIPRSPTLDNYRQIFGSKPIGPPATNPFLFKYSIGRWFINSTVIAVIGAISSTAVALCMAFGVSKYRFRGRTVVMALIVLSLVIPAQVVFVQRFVLVRTIGLYNSLIAVILPGIVSVGSIWFLVQYMKSIPDDFLDMGRLDGLGAYGLLYRVVAPLCMPAVAALMAMYLVGIWGDYLWPLVILRKPALFTIALGVREVIVRDVLGNLDFNPGLMFAGATIAMAPGLVLFIAFQKYFTEGLFAKGSGR